MNPNAMSLSALGAELDRRQAAAEDYVADTRDLTVVTESEGAEYQLQIKGQTSSVIADHAHSQIAAHAGIPKGYYDRMRQEAPGLFLDNVHHWFRQEPSRRMIRTLDGRVRAYVSDRYNRIDNVDIARTVFESIRGLEAVPLSSAVTDNRLYIKILFPGIDLMVRPGDKLHPGFLVSNSEIGLGCYEVKGFFYRQYCKNGLVWGGRDLVSIKARHLGSVIGGEFSVITPQTQRLRNEALMAESRDVLRALQTPDLYQPMLQRMQLAAQSKPLEDPQSSWGEVAKLAGLNEGQARASLANLLGEGDFSKWGALNAITAVANLAEVDYDTATDLEEAGSRVLTIPETQWRKIADTKLAA